MTAKELTQEYLGFFVSRGHQVIPNLSLVPENDPSALFISAGMHPLVPYLLGELHPLGKRLCSLQKCLRTVDIESTGDGFHHTFFQMLGNWSLGDYWKKESLAWSYEFLTKVLKIDIGKISVSCFAGDKDAPRDEESAGIWQNLGIPKERIFFLSKKDNWWGPAGKTGPCGPDSEMFFDTGKPKCKPGCDVSCQCGKYIEIWNNVFMEYNKTAEGRFEPLKQRNVDTGMGVERVVSVTSGFGEDHYLSELFEPIIKKIEEISGKRYQQEPYRRAMRIIADHLRAATFIIADGIAPGNVEQGYILRRLIRRAIRFGRVLQLNSPFTGKISQSVIEVMADAYPELIGQKTVILSTLDEEEKKFSQTLVRGIRELERLLAKGKDLTGEEAFFLYETYGFPIELTQEITREKNLNLKLDDFYKAQEKHQQDSRLGAKKKFAGGLADHSEQVIKYHTATHLLHTALRRVLGENVRQIGSNLTAERLRFDFTYPEKLTNAQIRLVTTLINEQIQANLPVQMEFMTLKEAKENHALAFFQQKYGEKVKVYTIGNFSKEVCGGPHVEHTGDIEEIEIFREEAVGAGKRRIYARRK